jgi:ABC-2 type transport system permease protein
MNPLAPLTLMLRHEARLSWRQMTARTSHKIMLWTLIGLLVTIHLFSLPLPFILSELPPLPEAAIPAMVTSAAGFTFLMMVSVALVGAVQFIYARGDMDLLLSSPVAPHAVVFARVLTIAFGMLGLAGLLILPCVNVLAAFGYPRFLVAYVVLVSLALAATAIGVMMAQGMFWLLGARRTRLFAQIFAGILGLGFLMLINLPNFMPKSAGSTMVQTMMEWTAILPSADSWVWLPARAMTGEPLPFLIGVILCAGMFALATFGLADRLIANAVAASGTASKTVKTRSSGMLTSRGGPVTVMRRKEWLLIGRDPWLMTQIVQQILVILPALFLLWKSGAQAHYMWLVVVYLAGNLAGALAWLAVSTEEAADLLATAPVRRHDVLWAKLQAALIPTMVLAAVPVAVASTFNMWVGFTLALCSIGSAVSTSLLHLRHPSTAKRSELGSRGAANKLLAFIEMGVGLAWVVVGTLMLAFGWWGMLALVVFIPAGWCMMRS